MRSDFDRGVYKTMTGAEMKANGMRTVPEMAKLRDLAFEYASQFDIANGDSIEEFAERASWDVFPHMVSASTINGERKEFRLLVKAAIRERQK